MEALIIADIVLTLLLLSIMLSKHSKIVADKVLITYLFVSFLSQVYVLLERTDWMQHSYWMLLGKGLQLVDSPLFFMYAYTLTHESKLPRWLYSLVIVPAVLYCLHYLYYYGWVFPEQTPEIQSGLLYLNGKLSWSWTSFVVLMFIIEPVFLIWFYFLFRAYRRRLLTSVSNTDKIHLNWVRTLFYIRVLMTMVLIPAGMLAVGNSWLSIDIFQVLLEISSISFFFIIGYYGFKQTTVFTNLQLSPTEKKSANSYERSGLTDEQARKYHSHLLAIMATEKPYLNNELNAAELAQMAGITVNHLSQVLNTIQKQNFFDFINTYRVEEVKQRMIDPSNAHLTILAIALDSGFNSKTSFNTVFKKLTGSTPTQYAKAKQASYNQEKISK